MRDVKVSRVRTVGFDTLRRVPEDASSSPVLYPRRLEL
jgi:hypothetical protein